MAEDPILIKIQAVLDKEAESVFRKTTQEINNLKTASNGASTAQAAASATTKAGTVVVKDAAAAAAQLAIQQQAVGRAAAIVSQASRGSMLSIGGLIESVTGLGRAFGGVIGLASRAGVWGAVLAAIVVGWKNVCDWAFKAFFAMKNVGEAVSENGEKFRDLRHALEKLDDSPLDKLTKKLAGLKTLVDESLQALDRAAGNEKKVRSAEMQRELAKAERDNPDDIARAKAMAGIREKYGMMDAEGDIKNAEAKSQRAQYGKFSTELQLKWKLNPEIADRQSRYDSAVASAKASPSEKAMQEVVKAKQDLDELKAMIKTANAYVKEMDAEIQSSEADVAAARINKETVGVKSQKETADVTKRQSERKAAIEREQRRIQRNGLMRDMKNAPLGAQKAFLTGLAELDVEDLESDAALDDTGVRKAVLGDDISQRRFQVGDDLSDVMRPTYGKVKGARETAGREAMEARAAEAAYRKNPKNKQAGATFAKEQAEANAANANLKKVLAESLQAQKDNAELMTKYIETADAQQRKMLDRMNRRP